MGISSSFDIILFFFDAIRSRRDSFRKDPYFYERTYDWKLLRLIWESSRRLGDEGVERVLRNMGIKIEAAAEEMGRDVVLTGGDDKKKMKLSGVDNRFLYDYHKKTCDLIQEMGEDVDRLLVLTGASSRRLQSPSDVSYWLEFVTSLAETVERKARRKPVHALPEELSFMRNYMDGVFRDLRNYMEGVFRDLDFPTAAAAGAGGEDVNIINDFVTRAASVMVRFAIHTLKYRIYCRKTDGQFKMEEMTKLTQSVADLQHDIVPTNPKFMEFHLHFLVALHKVGGFEHHFCLHFCKYVTGIRDSRERRDLSQVCPLLELLIFAKLKQEEEEEEDQTILIFFAEIHTLLIEMGSLEQMEERIDDHPELLINVCLLQTQLFLKGMLLRNIQGSTSPIEDLLNRVKGDVHRMPKKLRRLEYLPHENAEYGNKAAALIEQVADIVASLHQLFKAKETTESMLRNSILVLLLNIVAFKAEALLEELSPKSSSPANSASDQKNQNMNSKLQLVANFVVRNLKQGQIMNSIFQWVANFVDLNLKPLFKELSSLESSSAANSAAHRKDQIALLEQLNLFTLLCDQLKEEKEDMGMIFPQTETFDAGMAGPVDNMIISSSELPDKLNPIKAKLREISSQFSLPDFPETHKPGFVDFLIRNLEELLKYDPASIEPVRKYIKEIHLHFKSLGPFLMKVSELDIDDNREVKVLGDHVANIAYKIEFVIDSIEVDPQWQGFFLVYDLLEDLRIANKRASRIQLTTFDAKVLDNKHVIQVQSNGISRDATQAINETVVDLGDEEQFVIDRIIRGSPRCGIVSIVGMPGIGKTTLAWKVFNNPNVAYHFHCRAWCTVSQVYEKRNLLLEILCGIHGLTDEIRQMSSEGLQLKLHQCLLRNKFLIVMDDVWDAGVWNELRDCFPDDSNGSRILITSRLCDVAVQIEPNGDPHSLRLLSDDESWNLLVRRVFHGKGCPEDLLLVGKEIVQKCKGLPLAVVAVSGLLRSIEKSRESWGKITESLIAKVMEDPKAGCMEILELSYKHLPGYLKPCFLYLGVFLEDKDIPVSKLIRFWLAEGFIHDSQSKSLEYVAEDYLMELINRSLVEVSKRRSNGMVKSCRLHDLLREFCQLKARAESFFRLVTRFDEPYVSFPSSDFGFECDFGHHSDSVTYEGYRLCIFLKRLHFIVSRPFGLGTRSLIFFPSADSEPRRPYDISFICHSFKLLRVLDFECIILGITFPTDIALVVHLRYLAVSGYMQTIPQSIANLRKLETFVVKGLGGQVVLPDTIWHMTKLRHLHVNMHVAFKLDDEGLESCSKLGGLVSLSRLSLSCGEDTESIIKRLPNLQKLRCIFFQPRGSPENSSQFPRLDFLTHLVSLNVFYYGSAITREFIFPSNLRKLTLSNFRLPWSHISTIGRLPNLEVLKLLLGAFEGLVWDMEEEQFKELKFLKLDNLNISQWNGACDHLPKLERLVLQNCKDLGEIPSDFADIVTLELIEVHWCRQSAEDSAKRIREATGDIKVLISSYLI